MHAAEVAARTWVDAWNERDPDARRALIEACVAPAGRILAGTGVHGRAELAARIEAHRADPAHPPSRITSLVDVAGTAFRFRVTAGDAPALIQIGELDGDGRIATLFTFVEPLLADPADPPAGPAALPAGTYVALWSERDPAARRHMLEACFAHEARLIVPSRTFAGHDQIAAMVDRFLADPRGLRAGRTTRIEDVLTAFRFGTIGEYADGSPPFLGMDAGEVDADGRIAVLIAFNGRLRDAPS